MDLTETDILGVMELLLFFTNYLIIVVLPLGLSGLILLLLLFMDHSGAAHSRFQQYSAKPDGHHMYTNRVIIE